MARREGVGTTPKLPAHRKRKRICKTMARILDQLSRRGALVEIARQLYARGWMAGTAGNLSARATPAECGAGRDAFWITASGVPKGQLEERDFLMIEIDSGEVLYRASADAKPSAEANIHRAVYRLFSQVTTCLHGHSVDAALAVHDLAPHATELPLPPLEMIKGLGVWDEKPKVGLPLFQNHVDVQNIADDIGERFRNSPPAVPALMIRNHGVTVWGSSLQEAFNRLECLEFLLSFVARKR